ncbi:MAG: methionine adenosyltransferase domain-containing protein, partial [Rhodobacterales bacterium]|nr:methionine adenosyltransferase domain-containing protein [Rhodobacterales bacterium]
MRNFVMTSGSSGGGHPDKLCDQISDAMVDAGLTADPRARMVAECALASDVLFLSLHTDREPAFDAAALARRVFETAGYGGRTRRPPTVMLDLVIAGAAEAGDRPRASNMVTAIGHACTHTPEALAYPVWAAHRLTRSLDGLRQTGRAPWLGPDLQAQVAVEFRDRRPVRVSAIAVTAGLVDPVSPQDVTAFLRREVVGPALDAGRAVLDADTRIVFLRAPNGGGPAAHSGLTGRKTAEDSYGGFARQSTAALSGKDPSRIDRTAAYAARQIARCIVAADLATECEVQVSYLLGDDRPASLEIDTF